MGAGIVTFRTWSEKKRIVIRFEKYYPPKFDENQLVTEIAREVETWIAEHPEQWSWNYHGNFIATL
jgi:KDO2-lipid IV(A) lauroyltransferase